MPFTVRPPPNPPGPPNKEPGYCLEVGGSGDLTECIICQQCTIVPNYNVNNCSYGLLKLHLSNIFIQLLFDS